MRNSANLKKISYLSDRNYNVWDRDGLIIIEDKRQGACFDTTQDELSRKSIYDVVEESKAKKAESEDDFIDFPNDI